MISITVEIEDNIFELSNKDTQICIDVEENSKIFITKKSITDMTLNEKRQLLLDLFHSLTNEERENIIVA